MDEPEKDYRLVIRERYCKACGICVAFCPTHVLAIGAQGKVVAADPERCTGCGMCELRCPDFAIELQVEKAPFRPDARELDLDLPPDAFHE